MSTELQEELQDGILDGAVERSALTELRLAEDFYYVPQFVLKSADRIVKVRLNTREVVRVVSERLTDEDLSCWWKRGVSFLKARD